MARNRSMRGLLVCVCLSLVLLAGGASAATEEDRRKIVTALDALSLSLLQPIILATGSEIVHTLTLINALAIRLPDLLPDALEAIVQSLLSNPLVVAVDDDILGTAAEASPVTQADVSADASPAPGLWGTYRIGVPNVQQLQPKPNGAGVTVAPSWIRGSIVSIPRCERISSRIRGSAPLPERIRASMTTAMGRTSLGLSPPPGIRMNSSAWLLKPNSYR